MNHSGGLIHIRKFGGTARPVVFTICGKRVGFLNTQRDLNGVTCQQCAMKALMWPRLSNEVK
jgi:DNA-directed RNA polymerase subunit RPC12/RpoP